MKLSLEEALARATPGPLIADQDRVLGLDSQIEQLTDNRGTEREWECVGATDGDGISEVVALAHPNNAALLAHCRNNLPRLLAAVKAERDALNAWREALDAGCLNGEGLRLRRAWLATHAERDAAIEAAKEVET